jgi:hypothetical protein
MADLDDRYGRRSTSRRPALIAAAVAVTAAVAWSAWFALTSGNPDVTWQDVGFRTTATGVEVTFEVTFKGSVDDDARAVCTLQAQNDVHSEVGSRDVSVGPAAEGRLRVTAAVATSETAVTGLVRSCAMAD